MSRLALLTPREREIAVLVSRGLRNKMIAKESGISEGTVKIHLHSIYTKMNICNRAQLAVLVVRQKAA